VATPLSRADLCWEIEEDIPPATHHHRDSRFVFQRVPELTAELLGEGAGARALDVASGFGEQMALLRRRGWQAWGLDASADLARHCGRRFSADGGAQVVCALAEAFPFRDDSFSRVLCQGSFDHFAQPEAFLREAARVLRPDGLAVIVVSNYDSLSCRIGRALYRLRRSAGLPVLPGRPYWEIPPNHTFRCTLRVLRRMAGPHFELVACRGASLFWLFGGWYRLLHALPERVAVALLRAADRIAYRVPSLADYIVSVWRPRKV
jgi:SAM-dependent methyltransferase